MTHWVIVRCEYHRERAVARQIEAMGGRSWFPCLKYITARKTPSTQNAEPKMKDKPIRHGLLLAFLEPYKAEEVATWDDVAGLVRIAAYGPPYCVPEASVKRFMDMVKAINDGVERSFARRMERKRPKKVVLKGFTIETRDEVMSRLFGLEVPEMQEAA